MVLNRKGIQTIENKRFNRELTYVALSAAMLDFVAYKGISQVFLLLYVGFCLGGLFFSMYTPLYIRFAVIYATALIEYSNAFSLVIWALTIGPIVINYLSIRKWKIESQKLILLFVSAVIFFLSCSFGIGSRYTSFVMQCLYILAFMCATSLQKPRQLRLAFYAFIMAGIFVCIVVFLELIGGTAHWIGYGYRLTYNRNERDLANAMTVPAYYFLYKLFGDIDNDALFPSRKIGQYKLLDALKLIPFLLLLFLSYSRGNFIAVVVPIVFVLLRGGKKNRFKIIVAILVLVVGFSFVVEKLDIKFRFDELLNYQGSINVRFNIWKYYLGRLSENPVRLLFGFGPGELMRIADDSAYSNFYAHSAFLDYLFAFGMTGFLLIIYLAVRSFKEPAKNNDSFLMGFSLLTLIMFIPYGVSASFELHIMLGICSGSTLRTYSGDDIYA